MDKERKIKDLMMTLNGLLHNKDSLNSYVTQSKYTNNIKKTRNKSKSRSRSRNYVSDNFISKKTIMNKLLKIIEKLDTISIEFNTKDR